MWEDFDEHFPHMRGGWSGGRMTRDGSPCEEEDGTNRV